ncbi:uncharacterized protein LOC121864030 [Homarus americanus]|nr:uncharacterized protein LOC121864030 [Homarus americanus]XP_042218854.1 uncharacterized protein LOC121864030 [Homarus americanus]XP_042218855.1 uncharacterized protein LOC121864030 [Homarus americanus]
MKTDTVSATARGSYESFDCAQAVALIAFIGLLSNLQDTIEEFVNNGGGGKRRRRRNDIGEAPPSILSQTFPLADLLGGAQWENIVHPVLKSIQWMANGGEESEEDNRGGEDTSRERQMMEEEEGEEEDTFRKRYEMELNDDNYEENRDLHPKGNSDYYSDETDDPNTNSESRPGLLNDLAQIAPRLAMWLVDVGDGRVLPDTGRAGVCRATNTLTTNHGWIGSIAVKLLMNTFVGALAKNEPTRSLLHEAGVATGTPVCQQMS